MKSDSPLGQVAVSLGYATPEQIDAALKEQQRRAQGDERIRIGMLLCEMGAMTPTQLFRLLAHSRDTLNIPSEDAIRLAARLRSSSLPDVQVILITSAAQGEGKTTIASQLATVMALMGRDDVLLIDGNLRQPALHQQFSLPREAGLTDVIGQEAGFDAPVQATDVPRLSLLTAGRAVDDFIYLLMDDRCGEVMTQLRQSYRTIIMDTASLLAYPDTALMVPHADAVMLVVAAGQRRKAEVLEMKRLLDGMQANILGVMLSE